MADSRGWYIMHRGWMGSADFRPEPYTEREAYLWSIEQAAYEPHLQWFNGVQVPVAKGEFVTSLHKMAGALGWSVKRARLFTDRMIRAQKWAKRGANAGAKAPTIVTVRNWERFQTLPRREGKGGAHRRTKRGQSQGKARAKNRTSIQPQEKPQGNKREGLRPVLPPCRTSRRSQSGRLLLTAADGRRCSRRWKRTAISPPNSAGQWSRSSKRSRSFAGAGSRWSGTCTSTREARRSSPAQ